MITPMKKATILCLAADREAAVKALREVGVLHVIAGESAASSASAASPEMGAGSSAEAQQERERTVRAQRILQEVALAVGADATPKGLTPVEAAGLVEKVLALEGEREGLEKRLVSLKAEEEGQEALGEFDPEQARGLRAKGVEVKLVRVPLKQALELEGVWTPLGASATHRYFVSVSFGAESAVGGAASLPEGVEEVAMPQRALSAVRAEEADVEASLTGVRKELAGLAPQAGALSPRVATLDEAIAFRKVSETLCNHGVVSSLDGFLPAAQVSRLQSAARAAGWALWIRDPEAGEKVPVSLTLPRWLRPISVLFTGLGILPGYREVDVSSVFLVFFSIFFAMIVGDAGYGVLLLAAILGLRAKFRKASSKPFWLFGVFAVATIVWGALTGSWFAIDPKYLPEWMRGVPWLKLDENVMWLCFLIGSVHLTIANLWNALVLWPSRKAFAQVGWGMLNWTMFFVAGMLVANRALPTAALVVGGVGFVLVALFMLDKEEIKTEWINYPMLTLNLVSALVDVMSYIRLFAVGMASAKIAMNFNQMAMALELPVWVKPLPVLLILLFGHGLNLVLGALSVLVHAVRLNTLEFSNHIGLTWAGEPYRPFGGKPSEGR